MLLEADVGVGVGVGGAEDGLVGGGVGVFVSRCIDENADPMGDDTAPEVV